MVSWLSEKIKVRTRRAARLRTFSFVIKWSTMPIANISPIGAGPQGSVELKGNEGEVFTREADIRTRTAGARVADGRAVGIGDDCVAGEFA